MMGVNINCKFYNRLLCEHPERIVQVGWFPRLVFKRGCILVEKSDATCSLQEKYPRPAIHQKPKKNKRLDPITVDMSKYAEAGFDAIWGLHTTRR